MRRPPRIPASPPDRRVLSACFLVCWAVSRSFWPVGRPRSSRSVVSSHRRALRAAGRLLPAAGPPERHRLDRLRLLPVEHPRAGTRPRNRPRFAPDPSRGRVGNDTAHRPWHPAGAAAPAGLPRRIKLAGPCRPGGAQPGPGDRRVPSPRRTVRRDSGHAIRRPVRRVATSCVAPRPVCRRVRDPWVPFSVRRACAGGGPAGTGERDGFSWSPGWGWRSRRCG